MDIAGLSMAMASNNLQTKVGTAVLSKAMDTNEALGGNRTDDGFRSYGTQRNTGAWY